MALCEELALRLAMEMSQDRQEDYEWINTYEISVGKSRGILVGTTTRLWAGGSGARIPARERGPSSTKRP